MGKYQPSSEYITEQVSLLDLAISDYDRKATEYYAATENFKKQEEGLSGDALKDFRVERDKKLQRIKQHLDHQRMSAEAMAQVQGDLDEYRRRGREATQGSRKEVAAKQALLLDEGHHRDNLELLEEFMRASRRPRPSSRHTAHHIVPGKGKSKPVPPGRRSTANMARVRMHMYGVRINDPDNGVWLPTFKADTPTYAMPKSKGHLEYHTINYEDWVYRKLRLKTSEQTIRQELQQIGNMLQNNTIPKEAR